MATTVSVTATRSPTSYTQLRAFQDAEGNWCDLHITVLDQANRTLSLAGRISPDFVNRAASCLQYSAVKTNRDVTQIEVTQTGQAVQVKEKRSNAPIAFSTAQDSATLTQGMTSLSGAVATITSGGTAPTALADIPQLRVSASPTRTSVSQTAGDSSMPLPASNDRRLQIRTDQEEEDEDQPALADEFPEEGFIRQHPYLVGAAGVAGLVALGYIAGPAIIAESVKAVGGWLYSWMPAKAAVGAAACTQLPWLKNIGIC